MQKQKHVSVKPEAHLTVQHINMYVPPLPLLPHHKSMCYAH